MDRHHIISSRDEAGATAASGSSGWLARLCRRQVLARLGRIRQGRLMVSDPLGRMDFGPDEGHGTQLQVRDLRAYVDIGRASCRERVSSVV